MSMVCSKVWGFGVDCVSLSHMFLYGKSELVGLVGGKKKFDIWPY